VCTNKLPAQQVRIGMNGDDQELIDPTTAGKASDCPDACVKERTNPGCSRTTRNTERSSLQTVEDLAHSALPASSPTGCSRSDSTSTCMLANSWPTHLHMSR
jgi:hypothetical protein